MTTTDLADYRANREDRRVRNWLYADPEAAHVRAALRGRGICRADLDRLSDKELRDLVKPSRYQRAGVGGRIEAGSAQTAPKSFVPLSTSRWGAW